MVLGVIPKFIISIIWDLLDFTIFRISGFGTIMDLIAIPLAIFLWGPIGIAYVWEVIDISDQIDGFIPTMTLIGVISMLKN